MASLSTPSNNSGPLKWAFNSATIMPSLWEDELRLLEQFGWNAAEIWYAKMEPQLAAGRTLPQLASQLRDAGVAPIGMCAGMLCTSPQRENEATELARVATLLDAAAEMEVPALTVVIIGEPDADLAAEYSYQVDKLRRVAEMGAERDVKISLEFLGAAPINGTLGSGIELVNRVNHPSLGLLFDFCHYYVSASHLEELPLLPRDKLFAVHVDDSQPVPMEQLKNDARCFPGEGRIDVTGLIHHLRHQAGYDGYFTAELYDEGIWKMNPTDVLTKLQSSLRGIEEELAKRG